jgi:hypothetical protein
MITLPYSLVIEATDDPCFFRFYCRSWRGLPELATPSETAFIRRAGAWKST